MTPIFMETTSMEPYVDEFFERFTREQAVKKEHRTEVTEALLLDILTASILPPP